MLIANKTSHAVVVELAYMRQSLAVKDAAPEREIMRIQVDDGPGIMDRAYIALRAALDAYNARGSSWKYWSA